LVTVLKAAAQTAFRRVGLDVRRYRPAGRRRMALMASHRIASVLDVGANVGQYAMELREFGFAGAILSFEPSRAAFSILERRCARDPAWECMRLALGDQHSEAELYLSSNSASSSLLAMLDSHHRAAPDVTVVGSETTSVRTLDSLELLFDEPAMLKLDVQGFEDRVLRGGRRTLERISLVECELSVAPLYANQLAMFELVELLSAEGFRLVGLEPGLHGPDGGTLQFDGFFTRQ
jgi:FkbM family methyltransferase